MKFKRISTRDAAAWFYLHFGGDLPAGDSWYWVTGIQHVASRRGLYVIAGDDGLEGLYNGGVS